MDVEIWSDIVCPFCYIGKRQFEHALGDFDHGSEVTVTYRSFELNPKAARNTGELLPEYLSERFHTDLEGVRAMHVRVEEMAAEEGLTFDFDHARPSSSLDGHRLIHLAKETGKDAALFDRLHQAYFVDGDDIGDRETLLRLCGETGLDTAAAARVIDGDAFSDTVRQDERTADELRISGVPFFVIDRTYGISGAQGAPTFLKVLQSVWNAPKPETEAQHVAPRQEDPLTP